MSQNAWWELHLRKARGEALSEQEQQLYDAELARQERDASPLHVDLASLRSLRDQVTSLARTNADLRGRVAELEQEIGHVEQSLSQKTREALGVGE
jgi:hypothetical protein